MAYGNYFRSGDWNAICDVCGWKYKASQLRKRWDGLWVCNKDWEIRQPLDFPVRLKDDPAPPFTRPYGTDLNVAGTTLTWSGIVQLMGGSAFAAVPNIQASYLVSYSVNYQDGPQGTIGYAIQPGSGVLFTTTQPLELSTLQYTITPA